MMEPIETTTTVDARRLVYVPVPQNWIGKPLRVRVELDEMAGVAATASERHAKGMAAMSRLASRGGVRSISDPVQWQREIRAERPLPGRD